MAPSFASSLAKSGRPITTQQDWVSWKGLLGTAGVTKRYTHVTDLLARDAAKRMGRALWD